MYQLYETPFIYPAMNQQAFNKTHSPEDTPISKESKTALPIDGGICGHDDGVAALNNGYCMV